jgi:signal transduction histidine kinase
VNSRTHYLTVAMLFIALLAIGLVVEAIRSTRRHRDTAEAVLHDFADLGAQGSTGRMLTAIAPALYQVLTRVREADPLTLGGIATRLDPWPMALARSATWAGPVDPDSGVPLAGFGVGTPPESGILDSMRASNARLVSGAYLGGARHGEGYLLFSPLRPGTSPVAILLSARVLDSLLQVITDEVMILPPAIYPADSLDRGLGIELVDGAHRVASRGFADSTRFLAQYPFGAMLGNLETRVRISEALAPALVIGGLPRSRVPLFAAGLALALLLAGAAVAQAQQERRLVQLREDVVAGASHELRTPLAQIRLFAETLRLGRVRSEEERARALTVIEREARRLEHLVDNLLHSSRIERGGVQLAREPTDLGLLTRQIVDEFAPLAGKGDVRIEVAGQGDLVASVDAAAWRQVMVNLLDNAVKYGGRGTVVRVELSAAPDWITTAVRDEGPGVPVSDRSLVWQRFWRGTSTATAGATGTGLGLATVHDLVARHGGTCAVGQGEPRGAVFTVRLPR